MLPSAKLPVSASFAGKTKKIQTFPDAAPFVYRKISVLILFCGRPHFQFSNPPSTSARAIPHKWDGHIRFSSSSLCLSSRAWQEGCPGISRACWIIHILPIGGAGPQRPLDPAAALFTSFACTADGAVSSVAPGRSCCCLPLASWLSQLVGS